MAESTLSLGYTDLMDAVSYFLFGQTDYTDLSAGDTTVVDRAVQAGYRQFLYPAEQGGYEWSFLRPVTTISTVADTEDQDLPDDFGRLIEGFIFAAGSQYPAVKADVGENYIRHLRAASDESGTPKFAGVRIKAGTGTAGQRREVMWWPTPDDEYVLSYRYEAFVGLLSVSAPYPVGAMKHGETLKASCLAVAELDVNDERGARWDNYMRMLAASIQRDKREGTKFFGNVGTKNEYDLRGSSTFDFPYSLTVSGTSIQ